MVIIAPNESKGRTARVWYMKYEVGGERRRDGNNVLDIVDGPRVD